VRLPLALATATALLLSLTACGGPTTDLDAAGVIKAITEQGLPVTLTVTYTAETDPNKQLGRPNGYTSKASFTDSRISAADVAGRKEGDVGLGGSVEVFEKARAGGTAGRLHSGDRGEDADARRVRLRGGPGSVAGVEGVDAGPG
jgi:hypothetical protein